MKRQITISYQHRQGLRNDRPTAPKLVLANHLIRKISGFSIGEKVNVEYSLGSIIISKLTKTL